MIKIEQITFLTLFGMLFTYSVALAEPAIEMVPIKGGCFKMGDSNSNQSDELPLHEVCLDDFQLGKYEVTQAQWKAVMGNNPSNFTGENSPVDEVSWEDTQKFIKKLNAQTGKHYRLPTEAEWEYAARSRGTDEKYSGTSEIEKIDEYAWYYKNSNNETHPVGAKKPNSLGLYDMSGNVREWVQDKYGDDWYKKSPRDNPQGPETGSIHVNRGGSWYDSERFLRATTRNKKSYNVKGTIGFRIAFTTK